MLTEMEAKLLDILNEVRDVFGIGQKTGRVTFRTAMGHIRDGISLLENKRDGCPSGLHKIECLCDSGTQLSVSTVKRKKVA